MSDEALITIRRDGQELGSWDRFQLRQYVATGAIIISDEYFDSEENKWIPLIPRYRRKWNLFDWNDEEDRQWYYIRDGFIHGPRLEIEIYALYQSGYLPSDTPVAFVGLEDWISIDALVEDETDVPAEASAKDHANEAINAYRHGDTIGAGISGFKAIGKMLKTITAPATALTEWLCIPIDGKEAPSLSTITDFISAFGYRVIDTQILGDGKNRKLAVRFPDIAEATRAKNELYAASVTDKFTLILLDRAPVA